MCADNQAEHTVHIYNLQDTSNSQMSLASNFDTQKLQMCTAGPLSDGKVRFYVCQDIIWKMLGMYQLINKLK